MSQSNKYKIEYYIFKNIRERDGWIINIKKLNVCLQYHPDSRGCRVKKYRRGFFKTTAVNNFILEPTLIEMLTYNNHEDVLLAFEILDIRLKEILDK